MSDLAIARLLHVLAVVVWIGGVAMVTLVVPRMTRHHWLVLLLSLATVAGAVAGSHGLL